MNKSGNLQKNTMFPSIDYTELKKNSDKYYILVDYLKLGFDNESVFVDYYLKLLVSENSDFSLYNYKGVELSISRFQGKQGPGLKLYVSYNSIAVELCTVCKIENTISRVDSGLRTLYTCEFKGQYFRLETVGYFEKGFWKDICLLLFGKENGRILRVDRTIDFFLKKETKKKKLYIVSPIQFFGKSGIRANSNINSRQKGQSVKQLATDWQNLEKIDYGNWYYGSRLGKRVYFRMYDKLKDLNRETGKGKELLYIDYLNNQKVVRAEFECLYRFCYGYTIKTFDQLLQKCDSVFHLNDTERYGATCYDYEASDNVVDLNKNEYFKSNYFNSFGLQGYTIFENNINPYTVLNEQIIKRTESQFIPYTKNKIKDFLREAADSIDI